jgi:hypothetical protein
MACEEALMNALSRYVAAFAVALGVVSLFAGSASAHPPFCICKKVDAAMIRCEGGFADGTGVPGVRLDVVRYDETIALETKFGADSTVSFRAPEGEFYVLFDAGPGQSFDVDYKDIQ